MSSFSSFVTFYDGNIDMDLFVRTSAHTYTHDHDGMIGVKRAGSVSLVAQHGVQSGLRSLENISVSALMFGLGNREPGSMMGGGEI